MINSCCNTYKIKAKNNLNKNTLKNKKKYKCEINNNIECIAKMFPDKKIKNNKVNGIINFKQVKNKLIIKYNIFNLKDGEHGFHVHRCGDITQGCSSGCDHFNPYNNNHGDLKSRNSHAGDLGNIISKNNIAKGKIITDKISIIPFYKNSIIGRMIIVHKDKDDLGLGKNDESLVTGNAGKRLACGIIGIKNNL